MNLAELQNGEKGVIVKVRGRGAFRKRIIEMGFVKGKEIQVVRNAPLRDPIEYRIMDYHVTLRRSEAALIEVSAVTDHPVLRTEAHAGLLRKPHAWGHPGGARHGKGFRRGMRFNKLTDSDEKTINVALVGNPNSGKTTLFNYISGARERVGNYSGVTVEIKEAVFRLDGYTINISDLPGTYSLTAYTKEELAVRSHIVDRAPDVVVNVIDSSNLERNLYLTTQLIDMDIKIVAALNMFDELERRGDRFDYEDLGKMIGVPMVPTAANRGVGIEDLFRKVIELYEDADETYRHIHINYGHDLEASIKAIQEKINIEENNFLTDRMSTRFLAVKLLEKDKGAEETLFEYSSNSVDILLAARGEIKLIEEHLKEDSESLVTDAKYGFVAGALRETFHPAERLKLTFTERIDSLITSPVLGFPFFLFLMWIIFQMTFVIGEYPKGWIESLMGSLAEFISFKMQPGLLKELIVDGAVAGAGGVLVFLPNILIMFFMISLMEDTGYMARASFIMDRLMHRIGLHGKSFIPLVMGFGCNVPAIMATRTLENRNDRLLTMLIIPFMSCSARLPVYVLLIGAFFQDSPGSVLFALYLTGVVIAVVSAIAMKKTVFRGEDIPFVMELPPYRLPGLKTTVIHMWDKGSEYLKKIAGVVLAASILIWALGRFPLKIDYSRDYDGDIAVAEQGFSKRIYENSGDSSIVIGLKRDLAAEIRKIEMNKEKERLEKSYIGILGRSIEPVVRPLGFDWRMGVSLLTGFAAKEIVVSTMGVLYGVKVEVDSTNQTLVSALNNSGGKKIFTPLTAFTFMIFVLIYFPCIATIAAIKRESGHWGWATFAAVYTTVLAWLISFAVYSIGTMLGM